jgi:8-oxo-dGTP diphosphatase
MADGDGNGWIVCAQGHRHWGRHGAAGLLAGAPGPDGRPSVLLILRASWTQHPGTWGPPGGARDSHEPALAAALREAAEECAVPPGAVQIHGLLDDDHGGWSYQTVIADTGVPFGAQAASAEAAEAAWVPRDEVSALPLHPGFAAAWPVLREALWPLTVLVDVANVMGSRADGWWRDRAGAAARLSGELAALATRGLPALPPGVRAGALDHWYPRYVLVLEGQARAAARARPVDGRVSVVNAPGSGDDTLAELAARGPGPRVLITADRELRRRAEAAGAAVAGPRWLLDQL